MHAKRQRQGRAGMCCVGASCCSTTTGWLAGSNDQPAVCPKSPPFLAPCPAPPAHLLQLLQRGQRGGSVVPQLAHGLAVGVEVRQDPPALLGGHPHLHLQEGSRSGEATISPSFPTAVEGRGQRAEGWGPPSGTAPGCIPSSPPPGASAPPLAPPSPPGARCSPAGAAHTAGGAS